MRFGIIFFSHYPITEENQESFLLSRILKKKKIPETSLAVQWFRLCAPNTEGTQVQFLVGKLTSYMPHDMGKKKKRILL